jgi:hypothetical protein
MTGEKDASAAPVEEAMAPPPAPRLISGTYAWRLVLAEGLGIVALVFGLLGVVFGLVGVALASLLVTAPVGFPFLWIGLGFLVVALALGAWRYARARQLVNVLRIGEATQGQIIDVQRDYSVRVNRQHPWVIRYQFQAKARTYQGKVRTLNPAGAPLQAGETVWILYLPHAPQWNSVYRSGNYDKPFRRW